MIHHAQRIGLNVPKHQQGQIRKIHSHYSFADRQRCDIRLHFSDDNWLCVRLDFIIGCFGLDNILLGRKYILIVVASAPVIIDER